MYKLQSLNHFSYIWDHLSSWCRIQTLTIAAAKELNLKYAILYFLCIQTDSRILKIENIKSEVQSCIKWRSLYIGTLVIIPLLW